jgi:carboxylesterase type B
VLFTCLVLRFSSYACPQTFPDSLSSGGPLPGAVGPVGDEFECLILQLNVPLACLQVSQSTPKLPLLVYIHGGGFVLGQINEEHNTALLVEQSIFDAQPIISASIQYRLGALGYLHTPEAKNANIALNDQRNALIWLQRFVGGFGGDPGRVTLFGESGGAMSICSHMLARPPATGPLFQRVILMSGVLGPMTAPLSIEAAKKLYERFLSKAGIEERGNAALRKMREVDVQKIVQTTAELSGDGAMFLPVLDQEWFGPNAGMITWDKLPELISKCEWVSDIILGTTGFEVSGRKALPLVFESSLWYNRVLLSWHEPLISHPKNGWKALQSN